MQAFIKGDNVSVIEFALRVGGGMSYRTIKLVSGLDFIDLTIESYFRRPKLVLMEPQSGYYSTNIVYARPGIFNYLKGYVELKQQGIIEEMYFYRTSGTKIGNDMSN